MKHYLIAMKLAILTVTFSLCFTPASNSLSEPKTTSRTETKQQDNKKKKSTKAKLKKIFSTKPVEAKDKPIRWSHAPFAHGDCSICHQRDDKEDPGKLKGPTNQLCLGCHEPTRNMLNNRKVIHKPVLEDCSYCHNPHNSNFRLLLYKPPKTLCTGCHLDVGKRLNSSKVKHAPVVKGNTCRNCHSPHASNVEHMLKGLPFDMCIKCHGKDGLKDGEGVALTNFVTLLEEKSCHHAPIAKKDCSACHSAHGGKHFRLLVENYPKDFYAPYSKKNFALCNKCHKEESISRAQTTTLTGFRDGKRNLHAVHVNRQDRGRTCRACHEVHATKHSHLIRETVPYGASGWSLDINYVRTTTGGRCTKTCHGEKSYKNR